MRSQPLYDGQTEPPPAPRRAWRAIPQMTNDRYLAVAVFLVGVFFSGVGIQEFGLINDQRRAFIVGFVVQIFLTRLQLGVLKRASLLGIVSLGVDIWLNVGGLYPTLRGLGNTSSWQAFSEALVSTGYVAAGQPSVVFVYAISVIIGLAIAQGAEYLWTRNS